MSKGKLYLILLSVALMTVLFIPQSGTAWPSDDQGGLYWTNEVEEAPVIDGELGDDEWETGEEFFRETFSQALNFPNGESIAGITISVVLLIDDDNLYVKVTWENTVTDSETSNSVGIAFAETDPQAMAQTWDRKVSYYDANTGNVNNTDLWNCVNVEAATLENLNQTRAQFCGTPGYIQPGVPDTEIDFEAQFGFDDDTEKPFFEFSIERDSGNAVEDFVIGEGTVIEFVVNPFDNISAAGIGHGAIGSAPLVISFEERCFFCQPGQGIDGNAQVFNGFFALMISSIFLALILSGRSESFAQKMWKVEVSEDMAKESVIMEMAYYNSSFISILIAAFFLMYSVISLFYGIWAQWGLFGYLINGVPVILGIVAIIDLINRNENPQEMEGDRPGTDVTEAGKFWLVPTLFLAITLLMLVFIGIDVIA